MPEVSVLMGIYNEHSRNDVRQAVSSILEQTLQDFEFIICDDGSEDSFYQWLARYCSRDPRIILLRSAQNRGLAAAQNRCLSRASGAFAARMDADDVAAPDRLEKQASFLRRHEEYALAGSCAQLIDAQGVWGMRRVEEMPRKESFLATSPFIHPSVMVRREVMEQLHGYRESEKARRAEDYDFFMRLYAAGFFGYNLQEPLLQYREDRQSYKKRKYRYRVNECRVRLAGFQRLGILKGNFRYVLKPLAAGLVPAGAAGRLRRKRYALRHGKGAACLKPAAHGDGPAGGRKRRQPGRLLRKKEMKAADDRDCHIES